MKPQASVSAVYQLSLFSWPLLSVRGGVALLFVLASLIAFDKTMMLLVWVFAIYMFFDGPIRSSGWFLPMRAVR